MDNLITVRQASERTGLPMNRFYNAVFFRDIPYSKQGRRVLFNASDVDEFAEKRKPVSVSA